MQALRFLEELEDEEEEEEEEDEMEGVEEMSSAQCMIRRLFRWLLRRLRMYVCKVWYQMH